MMRTAPTPAADPGREPAADETGATVVERSLNRSGPRIGRLEGLATGQAETAA